MSNENSNNGAGVLVSIFGILFSRKGFSVTLIGLLEERVHLIEKKGLWLQWPDGKRSHTQIPITSNVSNIGVQDIVMVAVKGYHRASQKGYVVYATTSLTQVKK
jgi:ketopantoate reductase